MSAVPRDDADRIAKYDAKVDPGTVGLKLAARYAAMKAAFAAKTADFVDMQLLVRAELGAVATIFPIAYGSYYALAAEYWKLKNTALQPAVDAMAQVIHDKWVTGRSLDGPTCVAIAINVFNITVV